MSCNHLTLNFQCITSTYECHLQMHTSILGRCIPAYSAFISSLLLFKVFHLRKFYPDPTSPPSQIPNTLYHALARWDNLILPSIYDPQFQDTRSHIKCTSLVWQSRAMLPLLSSLLLGYHYLPTIHHTPHLASLPTQVLYIHVWV